MLQQDLIRLTHKPTDPVLESRQITCTKHNLQFTSQLVRVFTGTKWTECPECRADARFKDATKTGKNAGGAYHQASLKVRNER